MGIPDQISWTKQPEDSSKAYRGATSIARGFQSDAISFGAASFGKNAAHSEAISFPSELSGGAIEINFTSPSDSSVKSSYPSIQPFGSNQQKPQQPLIEVVASSDVASSKQHELKSDEAPSYDGFQPHYAYPSATMNPMQMKQTLNVLLTDLVESATIDYYEKSPFVYAGRAYGKYDDCEFLLSIFADESCECIVELRRSSGESFQFANIENSILSKLRQSGAIKQLQSQCELDDDQDDADNDSVGFGFGFGSLPSLDTMELDSNFSTTDMDDDDDDHKLDSLELNTQAAMQILADAVDLQSMRDVLRSDIAHLNEQIARNEEMFKAIPDIINTLIDASKNDALYDCWAIKSYLGMISHLISCQTSAPSNVLDSIQDIQTRWSHTVINQVAPGVNFEFYPSQQIVRNCEQIMKQLK